MLVNRDSDLKHLLQEPPGIKISTRQISKVLQNDPLIYLLISKAVSPFSSSLSPFSLLYLLLFLWCPTLCLSLQVQAVVSVKLSERSEAALLNEHVGRGPHVHTPCTPH